MTAPLVDWPAVWPFGLFGRDLDEATFTRKYRHRLHRQGPRILRELTELREGYSDLVLLCHEPAGTFCHRLVLVAGPGRFSGRWWSGGGGAGRRRRQW